tara:strand:+ start:63 stop:278 length:216 start_codon:yes stop_codon:yes gene_type:complete
MGRIWNGLHLKLKNITAARKYLRQFKDMSVVVRLDNNQDFALLTKAKFKMHGMRGVKIINGIDNPREYHYD